MATILLQAAGAYLGGFLGSVGAAVGSAAGAVAGYLVDRALIDGSRRIEGPRLASSRPFTAEEGVAVPRLYGTARLGGTLIWATRFEESRSTRRQGKLGPKVTEYSYYANAAFALCEGEIAGIRRIWADGREIDRESVEMRVYTGTQNQQPDPLIAAKQGKDNAPAYRGIAYVVVDRLDIGPYGNRIPQLQFEVIRPVGGFGDRITAVSLLPGATEYGLSPKLVRRRARPGEERALNRNVLFAGTDIAASLDELQATCPNLQHVALIVAWFGDDLRAQHCRVRPCVTSANGGGLSSGWIVSNLPRSAAPVVSTHDGGSAYGGTPSDRSVLDAIAAIKGRGLSVTLYPFVMMDVADGNTLPDPYGGASQPSYPWRGRITCDPAPGQPDSADRTALADAQVSAFCGAARADQFSPLADTIRFSGDADDWGYRRFILHYAHLASKAGGVDAFLVGSELRGLTTLRGEAGPFPFVEQLVRLAADVRGVVGPETRITYGADWSEYFGYHPQDSSGDVWFHLDPLWASPAIDAVGIDNYMPLSDWRDADYAGGNPDGFASPYDADGLRAAISGGEGFDWYYASAQERAERLRSPITDGAHGKPWVYRYKDIASWWANPHFNRVGGVESAVPTAWMPAGKPVWFTELGCPAVDKGPNQPNVFPDPKSAESALPYFSHGGRSDIAQRRFLETHLDAWRTGSADNPVSPVYGGPMVDQARLYLWAWDARPFPAFPLRTDLWSDGPNWSHGHWLNGRLAGPDLGSLINAILADHGQPPARVEGLEATVCGYAVSDPTSARAAIEPLIDIFDLCVTEEDGELVFRQGASRLSPPLEVNELVVADGGSVLESVRMPDHDLPAEALLAFTDPFRDYQAATARRRRLGAAGSRQKSLSFPGVMETGQAAALLEDWLDRVWYRRETVTFSVPRPGTGLVPGVVVRLPASGGLSDFLVTEIEDGLVRKVSARQAGASVPAPWRDVSRPAMPAPAIVAGQPHALFLDLPLGVGEGESQQQFRVAAWQKPWRSQTLYVSPQDTGFSSRGVVSMPARLGRLIEALPPGFMGRLDHSVVISVELFDAEVASVAMPQLLNGANAAAVRSASGAWEIVQFRDAEEVAPQAWRLTGLVRGQLGTDDAMRAGAPAGSDFVVLDDAVVPAGLQASEIGLSLNWRIGPTGSGLSDDNFLTTAETGGMRALLPFSPVHLKAEWIGSDLAISWIRRGRVNGDSWDGSDIPLGEDVERYRLEVAPAGETALRTEIVDEPRWLYPRAAIEADFGTVPAEIEINVRQFSTAAGWGLPARRRLAP
jgi:hypothetical protein